MSKIAPYVYLSSADQVRALLANPFVSTFDGPYWRSGGRSTVYASTEPEALIGLWHWYDLRHPTGTYHWSDDLASMLTFLTQHETIPIRTNCLAHYVSCIRRMRTAMASKVVPLE